MIYSKVTGHVPDVVHGWMENIENWIEDQKKLGWKDSDICIILAAKSHQDARVFFCLYLKWKVQHPEIQIFFESDSLSQEWPLIFVCGK